MKTLNLNMTACAFAAATLLTACGGGGSTPEATQSNTIFQSFDLVRAQSGETHSYVPDDAATNPGTALPGNNETGSYNFGEDVAEWWGGVGTDSIFKGIGIVGSNVDAGLGVYVKGAGTTTWNINGASSVEVGLGTNPECVGVCKATIIFKATDSCIATINTPITILTSAVNTGNGATQVNGATPRYTSNLTDTNWTVSGCGETTNMTAFKQLPLKEVHAQMLRANMQTSTLAPDSDRYANGINLGAVKFE